MGGRAGAGAAEGRMNELVKYEAPLPANPNQRTKEQDAQKLDMEQRERRDCPACQTKSAHSLEDWKRHPRAGTGYAGDRSAGG